MKKLKPVGREKSEFQQSTKNENFILGAFWEKITWKPFTEFQTLINFEQFFRILSEQMKQGCQNCSLSLQRIL